MRTLLALIGAVAIIGLTGCAQLDGQSSAVSAGASNAPTGVGIYKNPNGYCRLATRGSEFERTLRKMGYWRYQGKRPTVDEACQALKAGAMCSSIDDKSCVPPTS